MKRLTETRTVWETILRDGDGVKQFRLAGDEHWLTFDDETVLKSPVMSAVAELAKYEDAEESRRLFRKPYNINDEVYIILNRNIHRFCVAGYELCDCNGDFYMIRLKEDTFGWEMNCDSRVARFSVFASRKEAEEALANMKPWRR